MHVFEADRDSIPLLAPDGLTVIIMPRPSLITKLRRSSCLFLPIHGITTLPSFILSALTIKCVLAGIPHRGIHPTGNSLHVCLKKRKLPRPSLRHTNWPSCLQVSNARGGWNCPLTCPDPFPWRDTHRS